jgi:hypothetical protein
MLRRNRFIAVLIAPLILGCVIAAAQDQAGSTPKEPPASSPPPATQPPAPQTPAPQTPAPQTPASKSPAPQTPASKSPAPQGPAPPAPGVQTPGAPASGAPTPAPPASGAPTPADAGSASPSRRAELDTVYLMDVDGRLVPYPGMTMDKFRQIYLDSQALREQDQTPDFTIQSLMATGRAYQDRVELNVKLSVVVRSDGWVRVPLRFGQAALRSLPGNGLSGAPLITVSEQTGQESTPGDPRDYTLWLRGTGKEATEEVNLSFMAPLSGVGRERRMLLSVPRATVSELKLVVPMANAVAEVSNGAILETPVALDKDTTELTVRGLRGDLELTWRSANGSPSKVSPVLTSVGTIVATVERRSVDFEARLAVRAHGRELARMEVRLPPGAVLSEEVYEGYAVEEKAVPEDLETSEGRVVEVRFSEPLDDEELTEVRLRAACEAEASVDGQFVLAGFEVLGAIRQSGTVAVRARGEWDVRYDVGLGAEQVSDVPKDLQAEDLIAVFRYYEQPFSLAARVFPKETRVSVEPRYVISVEEKMARLDATLKYAVRGKKAYRLTINMNGWQLKQLGPEQLVIAEECQVDESGVLSIELEEGAMVEFELRLQASRPIEPDKAPISLALPHPVVNSLRGAAVVVLPADNIDLRPDAANMRGLQEQQVVPPMELPQMQQEPLFYRSETGEAVFAAMIRVRQQEVSVETLAEVSIGPDEARVRQRLNYEVKYEPATSLAIQMPRELAESDRLEFFVDGEAVATVADPQQESGADDLVVRQIVLPSAKLGRFEVVAGFSVAVPKLQPSASVLCVVPLVMPAGGVLVGNRVSLTIREGVGVWCRESRWQEIRNELDTGSGQGGMLFSAETVQPRIVFGVHQEDPDTFGNAVVHLAWVQTWMTERQRRDRVAYRFVSDRRHLTISLPEGADVGSARALLDGQEVKFDVSSERRVRVVLPRWQEPGSHVLEVYYHFAEPRPPRGWMLLDLPRVDDGIWVRRTYWQLVLPRSEHVIATPAGCAPEYEWGWSDAWWGRIPIKEQADLEDWVGAVRDLPVPAATSRYLFSNFGLAEPRELCTASRTWIVSAASGLVLLVGLLVIYVPVVRNPAFALILLVASVGAAATWPGPSLLFIQAAGMGFVLSLLGAVLYRGVARQRWRMPRREAPRLTLKEESVHAPPPESDSDVQRLTATEVDADGAASRDG